ncbi:MAG: methionine adenosyltransferase [Clostridiales bacterium]|jgi:S-adenosylmethionine synthetase|nr:methionine adenosyltransferase [Clostridiales bacterium]
MKQYLFTSESVTEGHPDKICDQISDAILDEYLKHDPEARVACEVTITRGIINIMGEISSTMYVDIAQVARDVVLDIGYDNNKFGFEGSTCGVITSIGKQSKDIAIGVNRSMESKNGKAVNDKEIGAGDQGMMFGYACNETPELMPLPIVLSHKLTRKLAEVRKQGILPYLGPDGKSQVTVEYRDNLPVRIDTVIVSSQHSEDISMDRLHNDIVEYVIKPTLPVVLLAKDTKIFINPTGKFVVGGPLADSGLTGRKIIVDTYGGYAKHGGGAFSGKDPTKVDRSATYAARWVAKNVVAAKIADRCEIQLAYAIGVAHPVSVSIDTFGTNTVTEEVIIAAINQVFDLRPSAIIRQFDLRRPIYRRIASYGHFGRSDLDLPWEREDKVKELKNRVEEIEATV